MRSFALSFFIPLAFGIFASAAPTPESGGGGLVDIDVSSVAADVNILRRQTGAIAYADFTDRDGEKAL